MSSVHVLMAETVVPISEAPKHYPYGRPNLSTVYRHFGRGVRNTRLETFVAAGRRYTTIEAIGRFIERTTENSSGASLAPSHPTNRQREAAIGKAERGCEQAGF